MANKASATETIRGYPDLGLPRPNVEYRYSVFCSDCGEKWGPSVGAGFSRHAGSPQCPNCGTDYRVWAAFNRLFTTDDSSNGGIIGGDDGE